MGEEDMVAGDGWISDESSFYGDKDVQMRLDSLCEQYKPSEYWARHKEELNDIIVETRARTLPSSPPTELINHGQGRSDCWQLGESTQDFIRRLPPLTTPRTTCEWIWVHNPHLQGRASSRPAEFMSRGQALLQQSLETRNNIQANGAYNSKTTTSQMLNQESKLLQRRISDLAAETNVLSGKWMLFPELTDLSRMWRLVVDGVINNRLGPTAKVAPNDGRPGARLICVYTKDFRDKEDILRVLQELVSMGIAGIERPIYYKSDPYTLLEIYRETAAEYGLQASLYSSQKLLTETDLVKLAPTPPEETIDPDRFRKYHDLMDLD